jgi:uncharacterized protein (TIGR02246 family)
MTSRLFLTLALLAPLGASCQSAPKEDPGALRSAIDAGNRQFMEAFARRDGAAIGLLYAEEAQVLPPGTPPVEGRAPIEAMWKSVLALPLAEVRLETVEVRGLGDTAWEVGRYAMIGTDGQTAETGKYIVIWKRNETGWKLYRDMWSSNTPAAAPAPEAPAAAK